ncbi:competence protein TfoX [Burkholderia latens]|uniref:Competence protein TfoX n=1 Tax=Burkholderia latens TaxID=488446 RepID=A0A6P2I4P7_9BURK|nr:TfoX/Sxy family protein [Burkholderia latens]VWB25637.1 competence protein TfoX [Burkholderia latens]
MVALVRDDRLCIKPTPEGRAYLGACGEAPPYPRAKPHLVIAGKRWDDREWLPTLVRITAAQLPLPVRRGR